MWKFCMPIGVVSFGRLLMLPLFGSSSLFVPFTMLDFSWSLRTLSNLFEINPSTVSKKSKERNKRRGIGEDQDVVIARQLN